MQSPVLHRSIPFTAQASRQSCKTCAYGLPCRTHGPVSCSCSHGSTCQLHSTSQSCGTCSAGLACHAHPRSQASCRCHQGFQCQLHGSNAIQKCRQCASNLTCHAHAQPQAEAEQPPSRRGLLRNTAAGVAAICFLSEQESAIAADQGAGAQAASKLLCDSDCQAKLGQLQEVKTASGLRYRDLVVGKGPTPPTGYQVVADYVAMTPDGKVFDSSLDKGRPYDLRIGSGQIVQGLDEGVASMRAGGLRRIYIPGNLSFPKGLPSGPGRPRVPPASPVMFDVKLLFIPGLDDEEE